MNLSARKIKTRIAANAAPAAAAAAAAAAMLRCLSRLP